MNEDAKAKFNEKFKALVGEEQLDKFAGGTYQENLEILNAMARLDPEGVQSVFAKVNDREHNPYSPELTISQGAEALLNKHFKGSVLSITATNTNNWYSTGHGVWKDIPHEQMLKMINDKVNAARG